MFDYLTIQERIPRSEDEDWEALSVKAQARLLQCAEGTVRRAIAEGLNPYQADRLCVRGLGLHPASVFGPEPWIYADDIVLDEDGMPAAGPLDERGFSTVEALHVGRQRKIA